MPAVLLVGNFLSGVGMQRGLCEDLSEQLMKAGWRVITTSSRVGRFVRLTDMVKTTWMQRSQYSVALVDVFSGLSFAWAEIVAMILQWANKPYVLTLRGGGLPAFAHKWPRRVTRLLGSAVAVTVPSGFLLDQMSTYRNDFVLLPNPIDLTQYPFRLRTRPYPCLIWLRAFHQIYNPTLAPRVLAQLIEEFPEMQLIMVGPDKGDGSLQETQRVATLLGVDERIQYPGRVDKNQVADWLNKGDIFLNTTHVDNTPVSVMEAMACGLCVVSTNVGGIPYLLTHEQDALLIAPDHAEQGAAAIRRILTDSTLATNLSQNARNKVQRFDWPVVLNQWQELLLSISSE